MADEEIGKVPLPDGGREQKGDGQGGGGRKPPRGGRRSSQPADDFWPRKLSANVAHRREGHMFYVLALQLSRLVDNLSHPFRGNPLPFENVIFCLLQKTYFAFASRRIDSWTAAALETNLISEAPAPNTLLWYLRHPKLTPVLHYLIGASSLPFVSYDKGFAIDSTHIFTEVLQGSEWKLIRLHMCAGVSSQVVTAARATDWYESEKHYFDPMLMDTKAFGFEIKAVMGDKNYISKRNIELVNELGATPYITFKKNNVKSKGGSNKLWDEALERFQGREGEDLAQYRERNIIETVNAVIKKKFRDSVKGIDETAQLNEALLKVICYNLCRLNVYDLNVTDRPTAEQWAEFIKRRILKSQQERARKAEARARKAEGNRSK